MAERKGGGFKVKSLLALLLTQVPLAYAAPLEARWQAGVGPGVAVSPLPSDVIAQNSGIVDCSEDAVDCHDGALVARDDDPQVAGKRPVVWGGQQVAPRGGRPVVNTIAVVGTIVLITPSGRPLVNPWIPQTSTLSTTTTTSTTKAPSTTTVPTVVPVTTTAKTMTSTTTATPAAVTTSATSRNTVFVTQCTIEGTVVQLTSTSGAPGGSTPAPTTAAGGASSGTPFRFDRDIGDVIVYVTCPVQIPTTAAVSVSLVSLTPTTTGSVPSSLASALNPSVQPFPTTVIVSTTATLSPTTLAPTSSAPALSSIGSNFFAPMAFDAPPAQIPSRSNHPVIPVGPAAGYTKPIGTNKFYENILIGQQKFPVFVQPYQMNWLSGNNNPGSYGMAITHTEQSGYAFGPGNPAAYYVNPVGIQSIVVSAAELGASTFMGTSDILSSSIKLNFAPAAGQPAVMTLPLVQGMGFVTALYTNASPQVQSGVLFKTLSPFTKVDTGIWKCKALLQDNTQWLIYVMPTANADVAPTLTLTSSSTISGPTKWNGMIQIAKINTSGAGEAAYDASAGVYATDIGISAQQDPNAVASSTGLTPASYTFTFKKAGTTSKKVLMFALPHHYQAFDSNTVGTLVSGASLISTTKGYAQLYAADAWTMIEQLPTSMGFAPWSPTSPSVSTLPAGAIKLVSDAAAAELSEDFNAQTNLNSMYFSGKGLAKFATIIYTAHDLAKTPGIAAAALIKLKTAFDVFVQNKQQFPLAYDTVWKGAVSTAGYDDLGADFGNTAYNDHHFHYGYFVYAAAVIAYLDPTWLNQGTNKAWVNMLVRDYANPSNDDPFFPFMRSFDWYHGHSWARGVIVSGAGKDQESSSEDSFASFAIKMWGKASGDASMEARGNLLLAIQARSFSDYYLMESTNTVEPANYIGNKAAGIMFEGKIDHTTYFGLNIEYIEGIHMLPLAPNSGLTRSANFVKEEWNTYFSNGRADSVAGGWRGVLYANLAYIDAKSSWNFFASSTFDPQYLDGGASRTWYLALAAAFGGV